MSKRDHSRPCSGACRHRPGSPLVRHAYTGIGPEGQEVLPVAGSEERGVRLHRGRYHEIVLGVEQHEFGRSGRSLTRSTTTIKPRRRRSASGGHSGTALLQLGRAQQRRDHVFEAFRRQAKRERAVASAGRHQVPLPPETGCSYWGETRGRSGGNRRSARPPVAVVIGQRRGKVTMALIDCPECSHGFSQYAASCPQCGFPNPLAAHSRVAARALAQRPTGRLCPAHRYPEPAVDAWQPAPARVEYFAPSPPPPPPSRSTEPVTVYAVEEKKTYDNSLSGFFHGKAYFWFALCVYYLGGIYRTRCGDHCIGRTRGCWFLARAAMRSSDCFFCCGTRKTSTETAAHGSPEL